MQLSKVRTNTMMKRNIKPVGIQNMIDVCPHCHQMVHKILNWRALMFCMFCNKGIW